MEKNNNRRNRSVLKSYFQKGDVPTEQQFAELIDSVSNIVEDGQVMRTPSGWAFFPGQAGHLDIGLYTEEPLTEVDIPTWTLAITPEKKLTVRNAKGEAVMETFARHIDWQIMPLFVGRDSQIAFTAGCDSPSACRLVSRCGNFVFHLQTTIQYYRFVLQRFHHLRRPG